MSFFPAQVLKSLGAVSMGRIGCIFEVQAKSGPASHHPQGLGSSQQPVVPEQLSWLCMLKGVLEIIP